MVQEFLEHAYFQWAVGIAVGLPLLMIVLGELSIRLQNSGSALYKPINTLRYYVVPAAAVALLVTQVVGWPADDNRVRWLNTLFWFFGLLAVLSFFNTALFINADATSWRAKLPRIFVDIARALLIVAGIVLLRTFVWGYTDTPGFFAALGVTSLVIGFTLQNSVGAILSGLLVLFEQPFKIGDQLNIGGTTGRVVEVNWRATHLDTGNSLQIVPNSGLAGAQFANFSRPRPTHDDSLTFKFAATDPPNAVKRMLVELARTLPQLEPDSEPRATVSALDGGSLAYQISYTVRKYDDAGAARDEMLTRIWYAATRTGLTISGLTPDKQAATAAVVEGLRRVAAQFYINAEQMDEVVESAHIERFAAGEVVQHPNTPVGDTRFILAGRARTELPDPDHGAIPIREMDAGDAFGGVTVLSDRTSARIVAVEDIEVVSVGRQAMERLLDRNPQLAEWLGQIADERRTKLRELRAAARTRQVHSNGRTSAPARGTDRTLTVQN